jgi:hypothetical protein
MHYNGCSGNVSRTMVLYWQTRFLKFLLRQILQHGLPDAFFLSLWCFWLLVFIVLTQCSWVGFFWWGELREEHPPTGSLGSSLYFSPFAWLHRWYDARWRFSASARVQLQQLGVDSKFGFSGHSQCRWPPPHHKHRRGCLQLAQTLPQYCQL